MQTIPCVERDYAYRLSFCCLCGRGERIGSREPLWSYCSLDCGDQLFLVCFMCQNAPIAIASTVASISPSPNNMLMQEPPVMQPSPSEALIADSDFRCPRRTRSRGWANGGTSVCCQSKRCDLLFSESKKLCKTLLP